MKRMPLQWVIEHQLSFINALCFVMMDLTNEVSKEAQVGRPAFQRKNLVTAHGMISLCQIILVVVC